MASKPVNSPAPAPSDSSRMIYQIHGADPVAMAKALCSAAGLRRHIPAGGTVSLKPNLVVARPAADGATTHTEILAGVIEYLRDAGVKNIEIIEGSWLGDDTDRAFQRCGFLELGKRYGVACHNLKKDQTVAKETPIGKVMVCRKALETDFLINLPVMKGHCQTRMTCALKNMKGCISDAEKRRFHSAGLDAWIAALATVLRPGVTLVDGLCGDLDFEEGGNPVEAKRMLLGFDPVKLDAYVCRLMGMSLGEVEYIGLAEKYGVGTTALGEGDLVLLNRPEEAGALGRPSGKARQLAGKLEEKQACSSCFANAVHALKRWEERRGSGKLPKLSIGQGWRGEEMDGLGIGECCKGARGGFAPGCPPTAEAVLKTLGKYTDHETKL